MLGASVASRFASEKRNQLRQHLVATCNEQKTNECFIPNGVKKGRAKQNVRALAFHVRASTQTLSST